MCVSASIKSVFIKPFLVFRNLTQNVIILDSPRAGGARVFFSLAPLVWLADPSHVREYCRIARTQSRDFFLQLLYVNASSRLAGALARGFTAGTGIFGMSYCCRVEKGGEAGYARRFRASGRGFGGLCTMIICWEGWANREIWRWGGVSLYISGSRSIFPDNPRYIDKDTFNMCMVGYLESIALSVRCFIGGLESGC